jgi:erythromycin esterase-like protein
MPDTDTDVWRSYERVMHDTALPSFLLDLREGHAPSTLLHALAQPRLERFIGVVYRPNTERWSHYAEAVLPKQFNAFIWFDETKAVQLLEGEDWDAGDATEMVGGVEIEKD